MKGIILAGGIGTRLFPLTIATSKQLLPVYDKPLIYYPISVLMLAGIRDILIISSSESRESYSKLLGNGDNFGVNFSYANQDAPDGLAQAFLIGKNFIGKDSVSLILGDNIFFGQGLSSLLKKAMYHKVGGTIFTYHVSDPERFGVAEFGLDGKVKSIEEKPVRPKSNQAVTGLYFYDNNVVEIAENLKPSSRGELEITDVNKIYLKNGNLNALDLGRGVAWLDAGTPDALLEAGQFVRTIQSRQGLQVACLEEIGFSKGWLSEEKLVERANSLSNTEYGNYLIKSIIK